MSGTAGGWCWSTTPSGGGRPAGRSSACCAPPARPRCTRASPPRRSGIRASTASTRAAGDNWSPRPTAWKPSGNSSPPIRWGTSARPDWSRRCSWRLNGCAWPAWMGTIRLEFRWNPWPGGMHWNRWRTGRWNLRCAVVAAMSDGSLTYRASGVDRAAGAAALDAVHERVRGTFTTQVLGDVGHFAGLFRLGGFRDPVLVSSIDGVGTKVLLARQAGRMEVVGRDAIMHGVNDVAVMGAAPLFALDYVAAARVDPADLAALVSGMSAACREEGVALLGGETAQMPGIYTETGVDVGACVIGVAERGGLCDGSNIRAGDAVIGLASNGLHTNGYSLVREVMRRCGWTLPAVFPDLGGTLADALLRPHRSYRRALQALAGAGWLRGAAHITGGGLPGNLVRILPPARRVRIDTAAWPVPPIFNVLARGGRIAREEMFATFNMGVGVAAVVPPDRAGLAVDICRANGADGWIIGEIVAGERGVGLLWQKEKRKRGNEETRHSTGRITQASAIPSASAPSCQATAQICRLFSMRAHAGRFSGEWPWSCPVIQKRTRWNGRGAPESRRWR